MTTPMNNRINGEGSPTSQELPDSTGGEVNTDSTLWAVANLAVHAVVDLATLPVRAVRKVREVTNLDTARLYLGHDKK